MLDRSARSGVPACVDRAEAGRRPAILMIDMKAGYYAASTLQCQQLIYATWYCALSGLDLICVRK